MCSDYTASVVCEVSYLKFNQQRVWIICDPDPPSGTAQPTLQLVSDQWHTQDVEKGGGTFSLIVQLIILVCDKPVLLGEGGGVSGQFLNIFTAI